MVSCSVLECSVTYISNSNKETFHGFPANAVTNKFIRMLNRMHWEPKKKFDGMQSTFPRTPTEFFPITLNSVYLILTFILEVCSYFRGNIMHLRKDYSVIVLLLSVNIISYANSEFITVSVFGTAFVAGGWYKWDTIADNTVCRFTECCNSHYVPYDLEKLKLSLSRKMFGQPLVNELVNIISAHKEAVNDKSKGNKKALVISLHGWSGVGKNYAAEMIADAIYKNGYNSKYVKLFMGEKDFDCSDLENKKKQLISTVNALVKKCPKSLIIFDEIHLMCPSVLDAIKPMMDHHHEVDGVDYRDSIFLFISNIGGNEITTNLLELYGQGVKRNEVEFHDFEAVIRRTAYFKGGFEKAALIAQHLIDHYIPFLPLEQHHVEMCALAKFREHGILQPTDDMMTDAFSVITYGPSEDKPIFANNGCKRFTRHIPYVIEKHKRKTEL